MAEAPTRVLLDTNVWSYLSDESAGLELLSVSRRNGKRIVVAPSVVYEALNISDPVKRQKVVRLMTTDKWIRLMPEAYSECEELRAEMQRLRPEWLLSGPDLVTWRHHKYDWTRARKGFWDRARFDASEMAGHTRYRHLDAARALARQRRKDIIGQKADKALPLGEARMLFSSPTAGWRGDAIEPWRADGMVSTAFHLGDAGDPYRDWLRPYLTPQSGDAFRDSWGQFWLYEVEASNLPRFWLRWAFEFMQMFRKPSDGTPGDSQLASYLGETDLVVSADGQFIDLVQEAGASAPGRVAVGARIAAGSAGITELFDLLARPSSAAGTTVRDA